MVPTGCLIRRDKIPNESCRGEAEISQQIQNWAWTEEPEGNRVCSPCQ
jgi:hypothetical protein